MTMTHPRSVIDGEQPDWTERAAFRLVRIYVRRGFTPGAARRRVHEQLVARCVRGFDPLAFALSRVIY